LFGGKRERPQDKDTNIQWIELQSDAQLNDIDKKGINRPQLIYKHSTTCGISSMVLRRLEILLQGVSGKADLYFLDVHRNLQVSDSIAGRYHVRHQSPQLLILKQGKVLAAPSHGAIAEVELEHYI
jgi:bacillithiol system protein YtxJ